MTCFVGWFIWYYFMIYTLLLYYMLLTLIGCGLVLSCVDQSYLCCVYLRLPVLLWFTVGCCWVLVLYDELHALRVDIVY